MQSIIYVVGRDNAPDIASLDDVSDLVCDFMTHLLDTLDCLCYIAMTNWTVQNELKILQCAVHGVEFGSEQVEGWMHTRNLHANIVQFVRDPHTGPSRPGYAVTQPLVAHRSRLLVPLNELGRHPECFCVLKVHQLNGKEQREGCD
jgi:hypothetical protein